MRLATVPEGSVSYCTWVLKPVSVLLSQAADQFSFDQNSHYKHAFKVKFHIWTHSGLHIHTSACTSLLARGDRARLFSVKQCSQILARSKLLWGSQCGCLSSAFLYQTSFRYLQQNLTTHPLQTHNYCPSFLLLRFTTITNIHRTYSLQTISITVNYDIFFLSCWHHYAVATSTRQIFSCNWNSKLTQTCPFLFAIKLSTLQHI